MVFFKLILFYFFSQTRGRKLIYIYIYIYIFHLEVIQNISFTVYTNLEEHEFAYCSYNIITYVMYSFSCES
jgi:hypothetical protein